MRQLLLLRHAKSDWSDGSLADFDRPLAARGKRDAPAMGREIARRGWQPDLALVSPAARTGRTWQLVSACLAEPPEAIFPDRLYMATPDYLLALLRDAPWQIRSLLVIGHNPGLEEFAAKLAGGRSDAKALKRLTTKFPTCALARLEFEGEWSELAPGGARLTHFVRPKEISGHTS